MHKNRIWDFPLKDNLLIKKKRYKLNVITVYSVIKIVVIDKGDLVKLTIPTDQELAQMSNWFNNEVELRIWSGPNFRYPFDKATFKADLSMERLASFCLKHSEPINDIERHLLVGFGQYYLRAGRCHLGRLVINPDCRGQNKIDDLIKLLADKGCADLQVNELSLFVMEDNHKAKKAYERLGFVEADYPETSLEEAAPMEGCTYMTKLYKA